jgi:hypothetical protein
MVDTVEQFYTVSEIAARLRLGKDVIRKAFRHSPGVVRLSEKSHSRMRIPESLVLAFMEKHGYVRTPDGNSNHQDAA